jgi:dihydrofolate reductase
MKLVLQMNYSLDGFVSAREDKRGGLGWAVSHSIEDPVLVKYFVQYVGGVGAHLMGSATYHEMAAHWPTSKEPYAAAMNQIPKIVFSRTLKQEQATWPETRVLSGDLAQEIEKLKQGSGKDLLAFGGVRFAQSLVKTGLIDVYRLIVHPVALGSGSDHRPLFPDLPLPLRLKLIDSVTCESGTMVKIYRPV